MSVLTIENLTQTFGEKVLYENVSLNLNQGEHMGIIGQNGVGKSTLIKLLTGEALPDSGTIKWGKKLNIGYLDQYLKMEEHLTIRAFLHQAYQRLYLMEEEMYRCYDEYSVNNQNAFLEKAGRLQTELEQNGFYDIDAQVNHIANGLGLDAIGLEREVSTLSGGQRSKVILTKLLLENPDVLLLDEPTNYLDDTHIEWIKSYLNDFSGSFMIVSHDYEFLNQVSNCVCDIEFGRFKKYTGNVQQALKQKEKDKESYLKQFEAQQEKIKKTEMYIQKNKAGTRSTMAKSRQRQLDKIVRLKAPDQLPKPHLHFIYEPHQSEFSLTTNRLVIGYKSQLLHPIHLTIKRGEKIALKGFNGIGKSTLLKTLVGEIPALEGDFHFGHKAKIAYFSQELQWKNSQLTPVDHLQQQFPEKDLKEIRSYLGKSGVVKKLALQPISTLSGGEQSRVKLSQLMLQKSNLLILDEPTNHIDKETKDSLVAALNDYPGSILLVSHEDSFLQEIADRVIDVEKL